MSVTIKPLFRPEGFRAKLAAFLLPARMWRFKIELSKLELVSTLVKR